MEISKGKFKDVKIKEVVDQIHEAGIEVMANYIFGLPGDTLSTMQDTLNLSLELCTSGWNGYAAMALPGSQLYYNAIKNNQRVPQTYAEYSFHGYDTVCAQTDTLTPAQVLRFRDEAFTTYHTNSKFIERIRSKYGDSAVKNIQEMTAVKLNRKLLNV